MTSRVWALGLTVALAAAIGCGDDDKPTVTDAGGDSAVPGDGSVTPGTDGGGGTDAGNDGGGVTPATDGGGGTTDGGTTDGGGITPGTGSKLVTSAGGEVKSEDGRLTVTFGRNTFERPTTVTIKALTPAPEGAVGTVYDISPSFEPFKNGGTATATLTYAASDLAGGSVADLQLGLYKSSGWRELSGKPNALKTSITAQLPSLGPVGILSGICGACAEPQCTEANCVLNGAAGKCVPYGNACSRCVPTCDTDNDGYCAGGGGDCNPSDPNINPLATEICNSADDNCNGFVDEGCTPCASDAECKEGGQACLEGVCNVCETGCTPATCGDGEGAARVPGICVSIGVGCSVCRKACDADGDGFCTESIPNGEERKDCDNANRFINPNAVEVCGNGVDDDCNGYKDDNCALCTKDADCAGAGLACVGGACIGCANACDPATCQVNGAAGRCATFGNSCSRCVALCDSDGDGACAGGADSDDSNPNIGGTSPELCGNGIDDNSNGHKDEGCTACKADSECPLGGEACEKGACNVCAEQCDPGQCRFGRQDGPPVVPGIPGVCKTYGNGCAKCRPACDMDGDGFCVTADEPNGIKGGDCDDTVGAGATINPDAPEVCGNGKDDNCAAGVDEGCKTCAMSAMCGMPEVCSSGR